MRNDEGLKRGNYSIFHRIGQQFGGIRRRVEADSGDVENPVRPITLNRKKCAVRR